MLQRWKVISEVTRLSRPDLLSECRVRRTNIQMNRSRYRAKESYPQNKTMYRGLKIVRGREGRLVEEGGQWKHGVAEQ